MDGPQHSAMRKRTNETKNEIVSPTALRSDHPRLRSSLSLFLVQTQQGKNIISLWHLTIKRYSYFVQDLFISTKKERRRKTDSIYKLKHSSFDLSQISLYDHFDFLRSFTTVKPFSCIIVKVRLR